MSNPWANSTSFSASFSALPTAAPWAWATTAPCWPAPRHAAGRLQRHAGRRPPLFCPTWPPACWATRRWPSTCRTWPPAAPNPWPLPWPWPCRTATRPGAKPSAKGLFALAEAHDCELDRRRHHARPAHHLHHRVWRSAQRPSPFAQRCPGGRRHLGQRHPGRCPLGAGRRCSASMTLPPPVLGPGPPAPGSAHAARGPGPGAARHCQQRPGRERRAAGRSDHSCTPAMWGPALRWPPPRPPAGRQPPPPAAGHGQQPH